VWYNSNNASNTLKPLFWDTSLESIDREHNKRYIIARILEFGDEAAVDPLLINDW
jgi:hypothetical protein